jgi:hypothetical protein
LRWSDRARRFQCRRQRGKQRDGEQKHARAAERQRIAIWWVTPDAYHGGYHAKLYLALGHWIANAFPFENPHFSNLELPSTPR